MLYEGDCLDIMPTLPDKSIDMILCDLPYQVTTCQWDTLIPFVPLWKQYQRIIKDNGAIVLTGSKPFTSLLIMSNLAWFKYEMIWEKDRPSDFGNVNIKPMRYHENILVFYLHTPPYNKSFIERSEGGKSRNCCVVNNGVKEGHSNDHKYGNKPQSKFYSKDEKVAGSVIKIPIECRKIGQHPTQKPVALFEYLIRTYTNENDMVLDNAAGSGTTGIAAMNTNRKYILIEKDATYCDIIRKRIEGHMPLLQAINS